MTIFVILVCVERSGNKDRYIRGRWDSYIRIVFIDETDLKSAQCTKTSRADISASLTWQFI